MKIRLVIGLLAPIVVAARAEAADWVTAPSYYTHAPQTGERVGQYAQIGPLYTYPRPGYRQSGFRHTRSSIQAGGSADHLHVVEEWGGQVRPYGEWRFPYRPFSVPYPLSGPPYRSYDFRRAPLNRPLHGPAVHLPRGGRDVPHGRGRRDHGRHPHRGFRPPAHPHPGYSPQPHDDGRYAPYDSDGPYGHPDLRLRDRRPHHHHREPER